MRTIATSLIVCSALMLSACVTNVSRFQMPGSDLSAVDTFILEEPPEEELDQEVYTALVEGLERRGFTLLTDLSQAESTDSVAVFEYSTDWHWDVTMYLLELRVAIYDGDDSTLIAQAQSHQSSLARKSPPEVVERSLASLFNESVAQAGELE